MLTSLCLTNEINDPGSKGIEIEHNGATLSLFVVHKDGTFHAYINRCPHTGVNLDWQENQFLDLDATYIQCATHDALFEIPSGVCIAGPCVGESLSPIEVEICDDTLVVDLSNLSVTRKITD